MFVFLKWVLFKTWAAANVDAVEELILSQERAPGIHRMSSVMHSRTRTL